MKTSKIPDYKQPENATEREARAFFEALNLTVTRIETGPNRTPDFLVQGDGPGYLLEAKGRFDDASIKKELDSGRPVIRTRPYNHSAAIERVARRARKQLETFDSEHRYYWLLWLSVKTEFASPELTFEQFVSTLYGMRQVAYADKEGNAVSKRCYYARPGVFEKWPEVDGAIISCPDGFMLCVNESGTRKDQLCELKVPMRLSERRAMIIPQEREVLGECLVADTAINRRDETVLRDYLRKRYDRPELQVVDFKDYSATVKVDP